MDGHPLRSRGRKAQARMALVALAAATVPFLGASAADAAVPAPPFSQCPKAGNDLSCGTLIVVNSDGTVSGGFDSNEVAYDTVNDALVGIQNNSSSTVYSIAIAGHSNEFTLDDHDGPCSGNLPKNGAAPGCDTTLNGGNGGIPSNTADTTGYGGPLACFSPTGFASGTVGFVGGLAPGATTWFALGGGGNEQSDIVNGLGAVDTKGPSPCVSNPQPKPNPTAPQAPSGLSATPGDSQVSLNWSAPASNGGSTITDYLVQRCTGTTTCPSPTTIDTRSTTTSFVVPGLTNGTTYTFVVVAVNGIGNSPPSNPATATPSASSPPPPTCSTDGAAEATDSSTGGDPVVRLYGDTRIGTAVALSRALFSKAGSAQAVVLARDDAPWDALSGGPLAGAKLGPLLLTETTGLDPATGCEIARVLPQGGTVFILGGPAAISSSVDSSLTGGGYHVVRLYGADRYATAVSVMGALGDPTRVFEATGTNFPDALAAGPAAIVSGAGILLTDGSAESPETASYLQAHPGDTRFALGGPAAAADPGATAIVGVDRYDTAAQIAARFFTSPKYVAAADGIDFPDALAGGPFAGFTPMPLLLVPPSGALPGYDSNYLASNTSTVTAAVLFGGTSAVGSDVENELGYQAAYG